MSKHTPGPWEIEPKERRDYPLHVMDSQGDRIAKCDGLNMADFGPNPEQCKANARLIAAAPDLLEACKRWVEYFDRLSRDDEPGDSLAAARNKFHAARVEATRDVIAKAEGRQ